VGRICRHSKLFLGENASDAESTICRDKGTENILRVLGHANITTAQRDLHLDENELADVQDLVE
jgi:hypothetical protein